MAVNPLKAYSRMPKIYIKLPSNNLFYPKGLLELSNNDELGVKALTAKDDLILKNPDALLNGEAVKQVVQSCINCKDVSKLLLPDVESILLGIFYSSQGDKLKFNTKCPKCEASIEESVSIRQLFDNSSYIEEEPSVVLSRDGEDSSKITLQINIKPSLYSEVSRANLIAYENIRLIQYMKQNDDIADTERQEKIKQAMDNLANFQLATLVNSIESITISTGTVDDNGVAEASQETVTDRKFIEEFIKDLDNAESEIINTKLEELNSSGLPPEVGVQCEKCNEVFPVEVKFNPEVFFEVPYFNSKEAK